MISGRKNYASHLKYGGFSLLLYVQNLYNVRMKEKIIQIRCTEEFLKRVEYLMLINGFKNVSDTIRRIIEKEYRKEKGNG